MASCVRTGSGVHRSAATLAHRPARQQRMISDLGGQPAEFDQ